MIQLGLSLIISKNILPFSITRCDEWLTIDFLWVTLGIRAGKC